MRAILLIRHGRTEANERRLYCGSTDLPLSPAGREELEALRGAYEPGTGCRFLSSGMRRTDETLRLLFGPVPFETDARMREMDFGTFEMRGYEELRNDGDYQRWLEGDNEANPCPGGESGEDMRARTLAAWRDVLSDGRDTVIVTHGGVVAAVMASAFPEAGRNRYEWQPLPGHGYLLTGDGWASVP